MIDLGDGFNLVMRKISSVQSHYINAHVTDRLTCCLHIWRHIFSDGTLSTNISMLTNPCKLLHATQSANDSIVTYLHMTRQLNSIGKDHMIAYNAIVRYVRISHQQTIAANNRFPFIFCTTIYGYTFPYGSM